MNAHAGSAMVETALLEPTKAQQTKDSTLKTNENKEDGFQLFGQDGLTFWDVLDIVNPLQHIPIVSTLYRNITGDQIDPAAKLAGGTLYGGPIGAVSSIIDVAVDMTTGKDIGEHAIAWVQDDPATNQVAHNEVTANLATALDSSSNTYAQNLSNNPYLAHAQTTEAPILIPNLAPSTKIIAQETTNWGMPGTPIAKMAYTDQLKSDMPKTNTSAPAPDLGLLADIKTLEKTGRIEPQSPTKTSVKPVNLAPTYLSETLNDTSKQNDKLKAAQKAYQKLEMSQNDWLLNSILNNKNGLYETSSPRNQLGEESYITTSLY